MPSEVKHPRLSVKRLAFSVNPLAALRLAPKEDFTLNAKCRALNYFIRRGWRASITDNRA
jgi:hypothetical protein